jgi:hypothetical protein
MGVRVKRLVWRDDWREGNLQGGDTTFGGDPARREL